MRVSALGAPLVWLLAGCTGASEPKLTPDARSHGPDTGEVDEGLSDEAVLRAAIAGDLDPTEALQTIASRGGLPIESATGSYLFACVCGDGDWSLAGDFDEWAGQPMSRMGTLSWVELTIAEPYESAYKFTDGSIWMADPSARRYAYDEYGEKSLVRALEPHLERGFVAEAHGLDARALRIFVPRDGFFTHMVVAHDGQNLFDPAAFHGGWRLDATARELPVLIVGIDNTAARIDEYTPFEDILDGQTMGGSLPAYAALVADVRSAMEDRYGLANRTALLGSSLGGLASFAIADLQPGAWDAALSLSGTMGWGSIGQNGRTILDVYAEAGRRDVALYLDSGGGGSCVDADGDGLQDDAPDGADNYCENRQFADQLAESGYEWSVDLWHWHEPNAPHTEAAWADRVHRPLDAFMSL